MVLDLLDTRRWRLKEVEVSPPRRRVRCDSLACCDRLGEDGLEPAAQTTRGLGLGVPDRPEDGKDVVARDVFDRLRSKHWKGVCLER